MAKVDIYCKIRKKMIKVDSRVADALIKMKRAEAEAPVSKNTYQTKVMVAAPIEAPVFEEVTVTEIVKDQVEDEATEAPKRRGRPPKVKEELPE